MKFRIASPNCDLFTRLRELAVRRRYQAAALMPLLTVLAPLEAQAQTTYTWIGGGSNLWNNASDWQGNTVPVSSANTILDFTGSGTASNDNIAGNFSLNKLLFDVASTVFNLSGNTLEFKSNSSGAGPVLNQNTSAAITVANNLALDNTLTLGGTGTGDLTLSGVVSGNSGLTLNGPYRTILSNAGNTYSGSTTVNGGILNVSVGSGVNSGIVTLGNSSGLVLNGGTLQFNGGIRFYHSIQLGNNGGTFDTQTYNDSIVSAISDSSTGHTAGFTKTGSGLLTINNGGQSTYGGATNILGGTLNLASGSSLPSTNSPLVFANGGTLQLNSAFTQNGSVTLNTGGGGFNTGSTAAIAGAIGGAGGLTMAGGGVLTLSNASNSYSGGTTISGGTIKLAVNNALPSGGDLKLTGGTLNLNGYNQTLGNLIYGNGTVVNPGSITGSGTLTLNGNITYNGAGSNGSNPLVVGNNIVLGSGIHTLSSGNGYSSNNTYNVILGGNISGSGGLNLALGTSQPGVFSLTLLSGVNTYSGPTTLTSTYSARVYTGSANALPALTAVTINSNNVLSLVTQASNGQGISAVSYNQSIGSLSGAGGLNLGDATLTLGNDNTSTAFTGAITGSAASGLVKVGSGTFTLSGNETGFGGSTAIYGGTLSVGSASSLGGGSHPLSFANGGTLLSTSTFNQTGGITLNAGGGVLNIASDSTISGPISGAGSLTLVGNSVLTLSNTGNSYSGGTNIDGGTLSIQSESNLGGSGKPLSFANGGTLLSASSFNRSGGITLNAGGGVFNIASDSTISGPISGVGSLTLLGNSVLTLSNTGNSYSGGTNIDGGTLSVQSESNLGGGSHPLSLDNGATLLVNGATTQSGNVTVNSGGGTVEVANGGTLQLQGSRVNLGNGTIQADNGGSVQYSNHANITGGYLDGPGTHVIVANGGGATFNSSVLDAGAQIFQNDTATFNHVNDSAALVSNAQLNWNHGTLTSAGTLTVNNGATVTLNGVFSNGVVTVNNGGAINNTATPLVLGGGSQTYVGSKDTPGGLIDLGGNSLELNGGLLVNNGAIQNGVVDINNGSIAKGSGNYAGGYTINTGGKFYAGNSPGTVTSGSATWGAGGSYLFQINDATGSAGSSWGLNQVFGTLTIKAGATPASLFTIAVQSLKADDTPGSAAHFDPAATYSWTFVTTTDGINGFDPSLFAIDTSGFSNPVYGGSFTVNETDGKNLTLKYLPQSMPVPERSSLLVDVLLLAAGCIFTRLRRPSAV